MPFVVKFIESIPGVSAAPLTNSTRSLRSNGSPPVKRILFTPSLATTWITRLTSSRVSNLSWGSKDMPFSGIQ